MLCWTTLPALVAGVAHAHALMARPIGWATIMTIVEAWHASVAPISNVTRTSTTRGRVAKSRAPKKAVSSNPLSLSLSGNPLTLVPVELYAVRVGSQFFLVPRPLRTVSPLVSST